MFIKTRASNNVSPFLVSSWLESHAVINVESGLKLEKLTTHFCYTKFLDIYLEIYDHISLHRHHQVQTIFIKKSVDYLKVLSLFPVTQFEVTTFNFPTQGIYYDYDVVPPQYPIVSYYSRHCDELPLTIVYIRIKEALRKLLDTEGLDEYTTTRLQWLLARLSKNWKPEQRTPNIIDLPHIDWETND